MALNVQDGKIQLSPKCACKAKMALHVQGGLVYIGAMSPATVSSPVGTVLST